MCVGRDCSWGLRFDDVTIVAVIPHSLKESTFSISPAPTFDSVSSLIPNYINRAHHVYSYVYEPTASLAHTSAAAALQAFADLKDFVEGDYPADRFAAFDFTALTASLEDHFGADHEQVHEAHKTLRETLKTLAARHDVKLAVVSILSTHPHLHHSMHGHGHGHHKRQPQQSPLPLPHPAEPIDSISTCYTNAETCGNATSSCSGHGQCVAASKAGKTCFVCACSTTKDMKGRKEHWAGNACERQDVSGCVNYVLFVLLKADAWGPDRSSSLPGRRSRCSCLLVAPSLCFRLLVARSCRAR